MKYAGIWRAPVAMLIALLVTAYPQIAVAETSAAGALPANLNLGSTSLVTTAAHAGVITVAGHHDTIRPGESLTAAEALALAQVLSSGRQTLVLGAQGQALGGSAVLSGQVDLSSLVIPHGVSLLHDISQGSALSVTTDLVNSGHLYLFSNNAASVNGIISATDIVNSHGGLIAGMSGTGMLDVSLTLSAAHVITNAGIISNTGDITLSGGGSGLLIANSGTIESRSGSIYMSAPSDISITNTGTIAAQNGNINVRDASYSRQGNTTFDGGGNWIANNMSIWSGQGSITGNIGNIEGLLNENAATINLLAHSTNLQLGATTASGDPTFYNIGNITINSNITSAENIAILATGNISDNGNPVTISAPGQTVTVVAGAVLTPTKCNGCSGTIDQSVPTATATVPITVSANGAHGGNISLNASTITAASTSLGTTGGTITLAAYASGTRGGQINVLSLNADGAVGAGAGNVNVYAGAPRGNAITLGTVSADGGQASAGAAGTGGNINIYAAQPTSSDGKPITFDTHGNITSGNSFAFGIIQGGGITLNSDVSAQGGAGAAGATGSFGTNAVSAGGTGGFGGNGGLGGAGAGGGSIAIFAGSTLDIGGSVSAAGGVGGSGGAGGVGGAGAAGASGTNGQAGGNGGSGGAGGPGGSGGQGGTVMIQSATQIALQSTSTLSASGGAGGTGAAGGAGGFGGSGGASTGAGVGGMGGIGGGGGAGGIGGVGGTGGTLTVFTPLVTVSGSPGGNFILATGGAGGSGGAGGAAGNGGNGGSSLSGTGGSGGTGGFGGGGGSSGASGIGGSLAFQTGATVNGTLVASAPGPANVSGTSVTASGGAGGQGGVQGMGGNGGSGANNGTNGANGAPGASGSSGAAGSSGTESGEKLAIPLTSLDLTNASVVSLIVYEQRTQQIGGKLVLNGVFPVGGNVILTPGDLSTSALTDLNVPARVTVDFSSFTSLTPVNVAIGPSSTSSLAQIAGTTEFTTAGGGSAGVLDISSSNSGTAFFVFNSGRLTSDGSLSVAVAGNMASSGTISASSADILTIATNSGSNGSVALGGKVTGLGVFISADGSGNITNAGGAITAAHIDLLSGSGNIGTPSAPLLVAPIPTRTHTPLGLKITTTGSAFLKNTGELSLSGSSAGSILHILSSGSITTDSGISSGSLTLSGTGGNVSITLGADLNTSGSSGLVVLTATGSGSITQTTGTIYATSLDLGATRGMIGTSIAPLSVNAGSLFATTRGTTVNINNAATGTVDIGTSSSASSFAVTAPNAAAIEIGGGVTSGLVNISGSSTSSIVVGGNVGRSGASITLSAGGAGISMLPGFLIAGSFVDLTSNGGNAGSPISPMLLAVKAVSLGGGMLNAYLNDQTSVMLKTSTLGTPVNPGSLVVYDSGSILGSGTDMVSTNGGSVSLTAASGGIGTAVAPLNLVAASLAALASGPGAVYVNNSGPLSLTAAQGTKFQLFNSNGTLAIHTELISASTVVLKTLTPNDVVLFGDVGKVGGTVTIATVASGSISRVLGTINGAMVTLTSGSGNMSFSTSASKLAVSTSGNVTATAANPATNSYTLTLATTPDGVAGNLSLAVAGNLVVAGRSKLTGSTLSLQSSTGSNGNITIVAPVSGSSVSISADGTGNITGSGMITGSTSVSLSSGLGSIGGSRALDLTTPSISANAPGGSIVLTNLLPAALANVAASGKVTVTNTGSLTVNSITDSGNGSISLTVNSPRNGMSTLDVASGASLSTSNGSIVLKDTDLRQGNINVESGTTLYAFTPNKSSTAAPVAAGNVIIQVGPTLSKVLGTAPSGVSTSVRAPGAVYFGAHLFTAFGPVTANALGANVIFSNGNVSNAGAITIGTSGGSGSVSITADPPGGSSPVAATGTENVDEVVVDTDESF